MKTITELSAAARTKLAVAEIVTRARLQSQYANNLSAAARAIGISPSYLHRIENANAEASADTLVLIMAIYGKRPDEILKVTGRVDSAVINAAVGYMERHSWTELLDVLREGEL